MRSSACRVLEERPYPDDWSRTARGGRPKKAPIVLLSAPRARDVGYPVRHIWAKRVPFFVKATSAIASTSETEKFNMLASQWERETLMKSNLAEIVLHPAYQKIIAMGPVALPLILQAMKREPGHWLWALEMLTNLTGNASPANGSSDLIEATDAWIRWGKDEGYLQDDAE